MLGCPSAMRDGHPDIALLAVDPSGKGDEDELEG